MKKKQKKWRTRLHVERPTTVSISRAYWSRSPLRVNFLRPDSLAQMLAYANVYAGTRALVHDTGAGLLTGAVAERLAASGSLLSLFLGQRPQAPALHHYPRRIAGLAQFAPLAHLKSLNYPPPIKEALQQRFEALLINTHIHPRILFDLLPFLQHGCNFVLYSQYPNLLNEVYDELLKLKLANGLSMQETWMREYQVLPGRTHPTMRMNGESGYLLFGTKLYLQEGETSELKRTGDIEEPLVKRQKLEPEPTDPAAPLSVPPMNSD